MNAIVKVGPQAVPALSDQVQLILDEAKRQGATACEVSVSLEQGLSVNVRQGEVETVEFNRDQGFGVTLYMGQRKGSASTSSTGLEAIRETVAAALAIARHTSEDECAGLADAALMACHLSDLDLYHPSEVTPERAMDLALASEEAAFSTDPRIKQSDGAGFQSHSGCRVYANSHGFIGSHVSTRYSLSCVMIAEADGHMQRDYSYDVARRLEALSPAAQIGRLAAERSVARLEPRSLSTAEMPVIFAAEVATGLLGHFIGAISGHNLYRQSSFLEGSLGQHLFPDWFNLHEDPLIPQALGSASFDGDGLQTRAKSFVSNGELVSYCLGTYSGRKLGLPSTANAGGTHNLRVSHGELDLLGLARLMGRGFIVTELMGQGVNLVTGDYSRGASGFWVEGGEIQYPVEGVTLAGNLRDIFKNLVAIGNDLERRGNLHTGSILVERMMLGSQ